MNKAKSKKLKSEPVEQANYRDELVRIIMAAKQLTDREVAERMGVKQPQVSRLKSGKSKDIKLSTLYKLAEAIEIDPRKLMRGPDITISRTNDLTGEIEHYIMEAKIDKKVK